MTKVTIQELAKELANSFITDKRTNGEEFIKLKDDAPEWMTTVIRKAHDDGDMLPDDWRYTFISELLDTISEGEGKTAEEIRENILESGSVEADIYNRDLLHWLSSNLSRVELVDESVQELGFSHKNFNLIGTIQVAQLREKEEVLSQLLDALEGELNERE